MKLKNLKVTETDMPKLALLLELYREVFILNHEEHFTDLGELLEYFRDVYGNHIIEQIESSDEIHKIVNKR